MKHILFLLLIFVYGFSYEIKMEPVLTSDIVDLILDKAKQRANEHNASVSITIVDKSGEILAVFRNNNAGVHTIRASYKKAYTANSQKRSTKDILEGVENGTIPGDIRFLNENFSIMKGGEPIIINGVVVGGIGVGGAHGDTDVDIALAGISALK